MKFLKTITILKLTITRKAQEEVKTIITQISSEIETASQSYIQKEKFRLHVGERQMQLFNVTLKI